MRKTTSRGTARDEMLMSNYSQGLNENHGHAPAPILQQQATAFFLQAAFADINIDKSGSVYYW